MVWMLSLLLLHSEQSVLGGMTMVSVVVGLGTVMVDWREAGVCSGFGE
jgi:hypothetical protein